MNWLVRGAGPFLGYLPGFQGDALVIQVDLVTSSVRGLRRGTLRLDIDLAIGEACIRPVTDIHLYFFFL